MRKPQADDVYEFFSPFAHVEGRFEWARIRSATHGVFDVFIQLDPRGTQHPATVWVHDAAGEAFMAQRYPECATIRVPQKALRLEEAPDGRRVRGRLRAATGPLRRVDLAFEAPDDVPPRQVPYGGQGLPVWGSGRFTCEGVDLVLDARVSGFVEDEKGAREDFKGASGLLTLGSYARITNLAGLPARRGSQPGSPPRRARAAPNPRP
jgi:hypothetical protein